MKPMAVDEMTIKDTAAVRAEMLDLWQKIKRREISSSEARLLMQVARTVLDTLKVEIAAAHLTQAEIPSVSLTGGPLRKRLEQ